MMRWGDGPRPLRERDAYMEGVIDTLLWGVVAGALVATLALEFFS